MSAYWESRQRFGYYTVVRAWLEAISGPISATADSSVLDVGCLDTPTATWGWFNRRYTVDIEHDPKLPGVRSFIADFMMWEPTHKVTVVTCLQVLEHLPDDIVYRFGAKLRSISDYTIVSVPFMWKQGFEAGHLQDPISLEKFASFMGGPPDEYAIVYDTKHFRIVGRWNNLP
jgi:hypothetical protein